MTNAATVILTAAGSQRDNSSNNSSSQESSGWRAPQRDLNDANDLRNYPKEKRHETPDNFIQTALNAYEKTNDWQKTIGEVTLYNKDWLIKNTEKLLDSPMAEKYPQHVVYGICAMHSVTSYKNFEEYAVQAKAAAEQNPEKFEKALKAAVVQDPQRAAKAMNENRYLYEKHQKAFDSCVKDLKPESKKVIPLLEELRKNSEWQKNNSQTIVGLVSCLDNSKDEHSYEIGGLLAPAKKKDVLASDLVETMPKSVLESLKRSYSEWSEQDIESLRNLIPSFEAKGLTKEANLRFMAATNQNKEYTAKNHSKIIKVVSGLAEKEPAICAEYLVSVCPAVKDAHPKEAAEILKTSWDKDTTPKNREICAKGMFQILTKNPEDKQLRSMLYDMRNNGSIKDNQAARKTMKDAAKKVETTKETAKDIKALTQPKFGPLNPTKQILDKKHQR